MSRVLFRVFKVITERQTELSCFSPVPSVEVSLQIDGGSEVSGRASQSNLLAWLRWQTARSALNSNLQLG
ncbi:hypothetical protein AOLI_G00159310 [Acnodon oligacanthus]